MQIRYKENPNYRGISLSENFKNKIKDMGWLPTHYVVSLKKAEKRREDMLFKLNRNKLNYKIIDAYSPEDEVIINYYGKDRNLFFEKWGFGSPISGVISCMASHFKALKEFIKNEDEIGVIIEDDILFRKDYNKRLREIISKYMNLDQFPTLITYIFCGGLPKGDELIGNSINKCWSTIGYLITKKYAKHIIQTYDKPHLELDSILKVDGEPTALDAYGASSELIVMKSGGLICGVPLVIENTENHPSILGNAPLNWKQYGLNNYE